MPGAPRIAHSRVNVLGVGISITSMADALSCIATWVEAEYASYACVTGVHGVMESQRDPGLLHIHNNADLVVPDGLPMVWCGRLAGAKEIRQVRGIDLTLAILGIAEQREWPVFFYGGAEGTPELLVERLTSRLPKLLVAGTVSPPFRPLSQQEDTDIVSQINESGARIVLVGLSTPKQERWMAEHVGRIRSNAMIGVGAAFDVHAGLSSTAPRWLQRLGLEWLYRLSREPRRLWRRYLVNNPKFLAAVLRRPPKLMS